MNDSSVTLPAAILTGRTDNESSILVNDEIQADSAPFERVVMRLYYSMPNIMATASADITIIKSNPAQINNAITIESSPLLKPRDFMR